MKLRLPLLLATVLLGLMAPSVQSAPTIHYFQQAAKGGSMVSSTSGSDHWTITASGASKFERPLFFYTSPSQASGPNKISDLTSISFTTRQGAENSAYSNLYVTVFTIPGTGESKQGSWYDSRLCLETAYASGFDATKPNTDICTWTSDTANSNQLTVCDTSKGVMGYPNAPTLSQMNQGAVKQFDGTTRDYRNEELKAIYLNFNDANGGTPGILDLYKFNMTLGGQAYEWNFVADDYTWTVDQSEGLGLTSAFNIALVMKGGSANADMPLLLLNGAEGVVTLNGGTSAIGADSTVKVDKLSYTNGAAQVLSLDGVLVEKVHNDQLGQGCGIMSFNGTVQTPRVAISNASFLNNTIVSDGHQSGFGNQLGSVLFFTGSGYDEAANTYSTGLSLTNVLVSGNTTETTFPDTANGNGGPQGTFYLNSTTAKLDKIEFSNNTLTSTNSSALGGAICAWAVNMDITNSVFKDNKAIGLNGAEGGALYYGDGRWGGSTSVSARIQDTDFVNNSAESTAADDSDDIYSQGGAIKLKNTIDGTGKSYKASLALQDVVFTGNTVKGKSHTENKGGAIYNIGTVLDISATKSQTFSGNAVLIDGIAKDEQGGFLYLATKTGENQPQGLVNFDTAKNATLTIGESGKAGYDSIAGTAGTLITKKGEGTLLVNSSMDYYAGSITLSGGTLDVMTGLASAGQITLGANTALYTGFTTQKDGALTTALGLGANTKVTAAEGSKLGTHIYNDDTANKWVITYKDLADSTAKAFAPYVGDAFSGYTYLLRGSVTLTDAVVKPGDTIDAGAGSTVDLGTTLPDNSVVISGGTVDASKVEGPLSDTQIKGSSGDLITTDKQEVIFTQTGSSGFNINGGTQDGTVQAGANLVITKAPDETATAPAVVLTGQYTSKQVDVKEGSLEIKGTTAVLGVLGGQVAVGADNTGSTDATASRLINNATILSHVTVREGSLLKGAGTFRGNVALTQGASLYVGNSPGRMDMQGSTFSINGNTMAFCLNGYEAATKTAAGDGHYSNIQMQGGRLEWSGANTLVLDLGAGLLATDTADVSFILISGDADTLASGLDQAALDTVTISQTGDLAGLLENSALSWDSENNDLVLNANLNTALVDAIVMADGSRIANALWSSTRSVGNFAHVAISQLDAPRNGKSNVWVGGLGDFTSVNGTGLDNGFDYNGGGYALGADYSFCKNFTAGLAFGQTFGTQKGDQGLSHIKQDGIMMALYGRSSHVLNEKHSLDIDGYFAYGDVENKGDFSLMSGTLPSHAKWNDDVYSAGLKASWNIKLDQSATLTPFVGIDYLRGEQGSLDLGYSGGSSSWYGGTMQTWTVPVGLTFKKAYSLGGEQYLVPEITIAYSGDVARQNPGVKTHLFGKEVKARGTNPGRSALLARTGLRWIITKSWSAGAYYTLETRSEMTNMGVNANVSYSF